MLGKLDWRVCRHYIHALQREISIIHDAEALVATRSALKSLHPDIVHTHTSKAGVIGRIAARMCRVPVVIHGVHILPFLNVGVLQRIGYKGIERFMAKYTDAFVSVGREMMASCLEDGIGESDRHYVIPSGMDLGKFNGMGMCPEWEDVLEGHDLPMGNPMFIALVSRLEERKGQMRFLDLMPGLVERFPNLVLLIVGEGEERPQLEAKIRELQIGGNVILTGYREDIEKILAISSIGILTSVREGLPRVLVQYALMKLPMIAIDIPGVREIVQHEVTGFLVRPDRLEDMARYIELLFTNDLLRKNMIEEIGKMDLSRWSISTMNDELIRLYGNLLARKQQVGLL
jgi:glycosyltransferase involved in cell wall biosynthesis